MRQHAVVCLAAVLATGWSGSPTAGQEQVPVVSEEEFLAPVLQPGSPAVLARAEELAARRADLESARRLDAPEIAATREDLAGGDTEMEAGVSWRPPRPDRRQRQIGMAAERLSAAQSSYAQALLDLRLDLRRIYADWAVAAARVEIRGSETEALGGLARRSEERGRAGETSGLDVRRLRLAELESAARLAEARAALAAALGAARTWRTDLGEMPRPELPGLPPAPSAEAATPPALAVLEAELRAAELALELAGKIARMPELTLGWKRVEPGESTLPALDGPVFGVSWPIPLAGDSRTRRQEAAARRDALAARLELQRSRFAAESHSARAAYEDLRLASESAQRALGDVEPAVTAADAAFRLGEDDLTTLLDTLRSATGAQLAALDLRAGALAAQRHLERVRGEAFTGAEISEHRNEGEHHGDGDPSH